MVGILQFFNGFEKIVRKQFIYVDSDFLSEVGKVPYFAPQFWVKKLKILRKWPPQDLKNGISQGPKILHKSRLQQIMEKRQVSTFQLFPFSLTGRQKI